MSSQVAFSIVFITWYTSTMFHVICLISRLNSFTIFTVSSYGSLFVSVATFITGPWIISAFFWLKQWKQMHGRFIFFGGGQWGKENFMFLFVFRAFFAWLIFHSFQNIWLQFWELVLNLGNSACKAYWFLLSILILLHYLTLKPIKSDG